MVTGWPRERKCGPLRQEIGSGGTGLSDEGAEAWLITPDQYLRDNPPAYNGMSRTSRYVRVRDGTRIAVDVHLPAVAPEGSAFPTIAMFTPYYRRFALRPGHKPDVEPSPNIAQFRDGFVPHGYALVAVDVRGCGASFGSRDGFRSPKERLDSKDIADWIVAQPWCDGNIGSTGISYVGAAADFLASTGHPAVKAVIPTFAVWDTWSNHLYPGGVLLEMVPRAYGELAEALDRDLRDRVRQYAYFSDPDLAGPAPVDEDPDGELLREALAEHAESYDMMAFTRQLECRDSGLAEDPEYTSAAISPYHYAERANDDRTAYYSVSGWMDGGGYTNGAIQRHTWLRNPVKRLLLGPWDHGARGNVSPWRKDPLPQFKLVAEYLRFFDEHLKGRDTGLAAEKPVHYFTMAEEAWKAADTWPVPDARPTDFYLSDGGELRREAPTDDGADSYRADAGCGTGRNTRYERLIINLVETYYVDWHGRDERMLRYTTDPLVVDTEVTGHPVVNLHLSSSEPDCALFVYLSDLDVQGTCCYVTEGVFRARHRKIGEPPTAIPATGPAHSFAAGDAKPLVPGAVTEIAFDLLPTSYLFRAGHRIRIAIAAADCDHFVRIPEGPAPELRFYRSAGRASLLRLPVVSGAA